VRRVLLPSHGARVNAAQALDEIAAPDAVGFSDMNFTSLRRQMDASSQRWLGHRVGMSLWDAFPVPAALLDRDGVVVSVNRAWRECGQESGNLAAEPGTNYLDLCTRAYANGVLEAEEVASVVVSALIGDGSDCRADYPCGGGRWISVQTAPAPRQLTGTLVVHTDITTHRESEKEWRHRALHDPLTGLANRALLTDRLEHAVAGAARDPRSLAVLFADLDAFKSVNDRFGHAAGDTVLCEAASRMSASVRAADTIGRWGGDEFLVIAERLDHTTTADDLAARLAASVTAPVAVGAADVSIGVSVGVAYLDHHQNAEQLVHAADEALQRNRELQPKRVTR
jgi:diguanylate cyclase (GGDEF)-like protein